VLSAELINALVSFRVALIVELINALVSLRAVLSVELINALVSFRVLLIVASTVELIIVFVSFSVGDCKQPDNATDVNITNIPIEIIFLNFTVLNHIFF